MKQSAAAIQSKNASIQLLRIVCSIFVIAIHILMNYRVWEGEIRYGVLFADAFLYCAVPGFFMISGMFMFRGKSFGRVLKTAFSGSCCLCWLLASCCSCLRHF